MQMYGIQKMQLRSFKLILFFTCGSLSQKHIVNDWKKFNENFMVAFFILLKKLEV